MAVEAAEVLHEWRRAERLLTVLPENAPERSEVEVHIRQLRVLYQRVTTSTIPSTRVRLDATRRQIVNARADLDRLASPYRPTFDGEDVRAHSE